MKERIRVAHILPWAAIGGVERGTFNLAKLLETRGHESVAYCPSEAGSLREMFSAGGISVASYQTVYPSYRNPARTWKAARSLASDFRERGIRLVHCADLVAAYYAGIAGLLAGLPVLCHIRSLFPNLDRRERSFLRPVRRFAFVAKAARDQFGYPRARRGEVVYDSICSDTIDKAGAIQGVRTEFGIPAGHMVVGMTAHITDVKDYQTLVRAAERVTKVRPETIFLLAGDYEQPVHRKHYERVQKWIDDARMADHFMFLGHRSDTRRLLAGLDAAILCTHSEGLPLSVLEAMLQDTPVIATAVGGIPEVIQHGVTGLLHAHENAEELADGILRLLNDPGYAGKLAAEAGRNVEERFSPSAYLDRVEKVYRSLL